MGKSYYLGVCSLEFLFNHGHTVKTFSNEFYVNLWNGYYMSKKDPSKKIAVHELYAIAKNVEQDRTIVASRTSADFPLSFLAQPNQIKRSYA